MSRRTYTITVLGEMERYLREEFEDAKVVTDRGVTSLQVEDADSAALHGVLHRLDALGLEVLDVRPDPDTEPP